MKHFTIATSVAAAVLLGGCERAPESSASKVDEDRAPSAEEIQHVQVTGQTAAKVLMESLGGQLKGALQAGGPVKAIEVCQQTAIPLTSAVGVNLDGVIVSRKTLKPRNPANAPDETDRAVLESMAGSASPGTPHQPVIEWQADVARFYHPLMIQEVCLNCHGDPQSFSPELTEVLAKTYPQDQATGYALGDFRGVIRIDIERP